MFSLSSCRILVYNGINYILGLRVVMSKFSARRIIQRLNAMSEEDKNKKAHSDQVIKSEIKNLMEDIKISLYNQNREDAVKYVLWQGILNQYGIFGTRRNTKRKVGKNQTNYYDLQYEHGDLISIDFGTSNIDKEFSFTHTAIVLKSYTDYIVVIPTTSCKDGRLENKPEDEQNDTLIISSKDYADIKSDSYIMLYQIRSVSKNRIQKVIGTIKNTPRMKEIDKKLSEIYASSFYNQFCLMQKQLEKKEEELSGLKSENEKITNENQQLKEKIDKIKKLLTES